MSLTKLQDALAATRAGAADTLILCLGDSTTYGTGATTLTGANKTSYPARLAAAISAAGLNVIYSEFAGGYLEWVNNGWISAFDIGIGSGLLSAAVNDTITATPTAAANVYDIYYGPSSGDGVLRISVTGGSSVDTPVFSGTYASKITVTAGSVSSSNVVTVKHQAGGNMILMGIVPRRSDQKSVLLVNAGVAATYTQNYVSTAYGQNNAIYTMGVMAPKSAVIMLGINDGGGAGLSATTFETNLGNIANAITPSGDVVICSCIPSDPTYNGAQGNYATYEAQYRPKQQSVASTKGGEYADVWAAFGSAYNGPKMSDQVHANDTGYQLVADTVFAAIQTALSGVNKVSIGKATHGARGFKF